MNQVSHAQNLEVEESRNLSPRKIISKRSRPFTYDHMFMFMYHLNLLPVHHSYTILSKII